MNFHVHLPDISDPDHDSCSREGRLDNFVGIDATRLEIGI